MKSVEVIVKIILCFSVALHHIFVFVSPANHSRTKGYLFPTYVCLSICSSICVRDCQEVTLP